MKFFNDLIDSFKGKSLDEKILKNFVYQIYSGESLTPQEAIRNLNEGVVEVIYSDEQHSSVGILITKNGYLLTPYHCIEGNKKRQIKLNNGKISQIKKLCAFSRKYDIALSKANLPNNKGIFNYKISLEKPAVNSAVVSISRKDGNLTYKNCFVNAQKGIIMYRQGNGFERKYTSKDLFNLNLNSVPGDSGSVIVDYNGKLLGFLVSGLINNSVTFSNSFYNVIELIERYRSSLLK